MSDAARGAGGAGAGTGAAGGSQLAVLLVCFGGTRAAGKARRGLDAQLKSQGDALLDSVVFRSTPNTRHPTTTRTGSCTGH